MDRNPPLWDPNWVAQFVRLLEDEGVESVWMPCGVGASRLIVAAFEAGEPDLEAIGCLLCIYQDKILAAL
jgi:hypothetical protein